MMVREGGGGFRGFANVVDPTADELRAWAYQPDAVPLDTMPHDWDLLLSTDDLVDTLFDLAMDRSCPARRFALHCLYIYAADSVRQNATGHRRRRRRRLVDRADRHGDEVLHVWVHNCRALTSRPELLDYADWCEGGLVRRPRRIGPPPPDR